MIGAQGTFDMAGERTRGGGRTSIPLVVIGVLYVASRVLVLAFGQPASDVGVYAQYAEEQLQAARDGASFYDVHARAAAARPSEKEGVRLNPSREEYKGVEYPPLALAFMRLPTWWMPAQPDDFGSAYRSAYRLGMAVIDAGLFALVVILAHRLFPQESGWERSGRLLAYLVSTTALWYLLYDRLDLMQTMLVMLSLALLIGRLHYGWSFALLAVAINFKLTPVVLAPVWIIGSWPANERLSVSRPRVWAALGVRAGLLLGLTVGCFLPFYLADGSRTLDFLGYHRLRGIEIESLYASVMLALQSFGQPVAVEHSYGSINVQSSLSPVLAAVSPWLTAALLAGALVPLLMRGRRLTEAASGSGFASSRLAQLDPAVFVGYTLLVLMFLIAANKVSSPQYLLWLAPLAALAPLAPRPRRLFLWSFAAACALSTIVFFLLADFLDPNSPQLRPPTVQFALVLGLRNLLFVGVTVGLAIHLLRLAPQGERQPKAGQR
jgi:hypothetical protein